MTEAALYALGLGLGSYGNDGNCLEVFFPEPLLAPPPIFSQALRRALQWDGGNLCRALSLAELQALAAALGRQHGRLAMRLAATTGGRRPVLAALAEDVPPASVIDSYLKLHLLSHRLCRPQQLNLDGLFGRLPNVAWTSDGAIEPAALPQRQLQARLSGRALKVYSVDKFPPMSDYVVPSGVRIADTARVRLGAWLGPGTTIMHEGFINFNAGTEGPNMIEGRISAGVVVGSDSDLGGGSSTMGTLSGGNQVLISVGKNCLIGANAGTGIPLGDGCTIEAGLYLTAGTIVQRLDDAGKPQSRCKARDLAGQSNLLFRRNSADGSVQCLPKRNTTELNPALHHND